MNKLELLILLICFNITKKNNTKTPNRIKILNDFENLILSYKENFVNRHYNNIILSNDKLLSKLQNLLFKKIDNFYDHNNLMNLISSDLDEINNLNNVYDIANLWIYKKYI